MARHFEDFKMDLKDSISLLKKIKSNVQSARTRFVRTIPALRGLYDETEDETTRQAIENVMAHLAFIIHVIDGKVKPEIPEEDKGEDEDEDPISALTQRHIDRLLSDSTGD